SSTASAANGAKEEWTRLDVPDRSDLPCRSTRDACRPSSWRPPTTMTAWTVPPSWTASARQESGERKGHSKGLGGLKTVWTQSALIVVSGRSRSFKEEETPSVPGADAPGPDLGETVSIFFKDGKSHWNTLPAPDSPRDWAIWAAGVGPNQAA